MSQTVPAVTAALAWRICGTTPLRVALVLLWILAPALAMAGQVSWCTVVPPNTLQPGAAPESWTLGTKKVLYYRCRFAGETGETVTVAQANLAMAAVNQAFRRMSFDQLRLEWAITPVLHMPHDAAHYAGGVASLLEDARALARAAGFDPLAFDLDMVVYNPAPGLPSGLGYLQQRGAFTSQGTNGVVIAHELGHNFGLPHANFWNTARPETQPVVHPPYPSYISSLTNSFPFDPDSLVGHESISGPGRNVEYGDLFDLMGLGGLDSDFNAEFKRRLNWLPATDITQVVTSGVYRVYALDSGNLRPGHARAVRLAPPVSGRGSRFSADAEYHYWIQCRSLTAKHEALANGVQLHWVEAHALASTLMLDTTAASSDLEADAPLRIGRSFHDPAADIVITPLHSGVEAGEKWVDISVQLGTPPANQPPTIELAISPSTASPGQVVSMRADATDPDGDSLAFFWEFGDGTFGSGTNAVQKSWAASGDYVVRLEVTDAKGGVASKHLPVRVGQPSGRRIMGRVLDEAGHPLAGVRVQNGRVFFRPGDDPGYAVTSTDSDGVFTLGNQTRGRYEVGAFLPGHTLRAAAPGSSSVEVREDDVSGVNFIGRVLPLVSVTSSRMAVEEGGEGTEVVFSRSGSTSSDLSVWFALGGTAIHAQDYPQYPARLIIIPAGASSIRLPFMANPDLEEEGTEQVTFTAVPPPDVSKLGFDGEQTNRAFFSYPGFELRLHGDDPFWHLTDPEFAVDHRSSVTLTVVDTTPRGVQRLSVWVENSLATERPVAPGAFRIERLGSQLPALAVRYELAGAASNGVDYIRLDGLAQLPAGQASIRVEVMPIADDALEGAETVEITLQPDAAYVIEQGRSDLVIQEDMQNSEPNRLGFQQVFGGLPQLQLRGEAGHTYVIEASINLSAWLPIHTNTLSFSPELLPIAVPEPGPQRFYRSALAPR